MVLSMFLRLVLANSLFSLRDINLTFGLLPPRRQVGVLRVLRVVWLLRYTDEPKEGETAVYDYNPALF